MGSESPLSLLQFSLVVRHLLFLIENHSPVFVPEPLPRHLLLFPNVENRDFHVLLNFPDADREVNAVLLADAIGDDEHDRTLVSVLSLRSLHDDDCVESLLKLGFEYTEDPLFRVVVRDVETSLVVDSHDHRRILSWFEHSRVFCELGLARGHSETDEAKHKDQGVYDRAHDVSLLGLGVDVFLVEQGLPLVKL